MLNQSNKSSDTATLDRPAPPASMRGNVAIRAAEALVPLLRERMAEVDRTGHVSHDSWRRIQDAGFIHALRPKEYGGLEWDDYTLSIGLQTLARGCAASAWCAWVTMGGNQFILSYPEEVHHEVWDNDTFATMGGNVNLNTKAKVEKVDGGYRLTGTWGFGSGTDFTSWLMLNAPGENGMPTLFLVDQREAKLLGDWDVTGLRGTNSQTMVIENVFVPDRRALPLPMLNQNLMERRAQFPTFDALWYPFHSPGRFTFGGVALGAALGAADYVKASMDSSARHDSVLSTAKLADQEYTALELAEVTAELEMARSLVELRSRETSARAAAHAPPTADEMADGMRDTAYICKVARRNVARLYDLIGSKVAAPSHPLNIAKRDIDGAAGHIGVNWRIAATSWMANLNGEGLPGL